MGTTTVNDCVNTAAAISKLAGNSIYFTLPPTKPAETFYLFELLFIVITLYLAGISLQSSSSDMHIKTTWVLYLILMSLHKQTIWGEDWSFFRLFTECYMFSLLLALGAKTRLLLPYAFCAFLIWLRLFLLRISFV